MKAEPSPRLAGAADAAPRFAVFTAQLSESVRLGILALQREMPLASWLIVLHAPRKPAALLARNQLRNLRVHGWRWLPYQTFEVGRMFAARARPRAAGVTPLAREWSAFEASPRVRILKASDLHAAATLDQVKGFCPDLGLSLAAPILRRALFSLPRLGTVNLHKGRVPHYRGMPPAFWELWNDEPEVGCTVHWVDDRLDTGDVVAQGSVARGRYSTLRGLQLQLDQLGIELTGRAVKDILEQRGVSQPQAAGGKTYRKPTLSQAAALRRRLEGLCPPTHPALEIALRNNASKLAWSAYQAGLKRLIEPRITVILYHRVSDEARDNLTVGIEQFDRQMAFLREHCEVLSIEQVLGAQAIAHSPRPQVAVTFDDGYLDNHSNAMPILLRHGIPAAFFVSTGIVGTDGRFPHDVQRGNPAIPTMSWAQLREMQDLGFTVGSHSVSHIDCAAEPEPVVRAELSRSREDLQRELGVSEPIFAYPYGGRQHMTLQRLQCVKESGYIGCLSAYGGSNIGSVDRFNVVRRGIHWEFTDHAFSLECLGLR